MKKITIFAVVLLVALSCLTCFVGCSNTTQYNITVEKIENGTISTNVQTAKKGEDITITITPNKGYNLVSGSLSIKDKKKSYGYGFKMVASDVTISAKFEKEVVYEAGQNYILGDGYLYYGSYPQTIASTEAVDKMETTAGADGYYVSSYDNAKYAKIKANPLMENYYFSNGQKIEKDKEYFFKVQPLKWLQLKDGSYVAEKIIDAKAFLQEENMKKTHLAFGNDYNIKKDAPEKTFASNYEYSDIREWLTKDFMASCFSNNSFLQEMNLDNSTTNYDAKSKFSKSQNNTTDKIGLLSYADVVNKEYGFQDRIDKEDTKRVAYVSDFARAEGAWTKTLNGQMMDVGGYWWLRSCGKEAGWTLAVNSVGVINSSGLNVYKELCGIRPTINFKA